MYYSNNPVRDAERYYEEQEKKKNQCPVCDGCEEPIQDEYKYEIDGYVFCLDCLMDYINANFRTRNETEEF